jgi:DNA-binding response OmpR family regulator
MPRILVVDDDAAIRDSVRLVLDTAGIESVTAESGERALDTFGCGAFDAAIVDLMLPGMSGLETVHALRARSPGLPVILVSGSMMHGPGAPDMMRVAAELDGVTSLSKPFKLSDLLHTVRAIIADAPPAAAKLAG